MPRCTVSCCAAPGPVGVPCRPYRPRRRLPSTPLAQCAPARPSVPHIFHRWKAENPFQFLATCFEIQKANASGAPPLAQRSARGARVDRPCGLPTLLKWVAVAAAAAGLAGQPHLPQLTPHARCLLLRAGDPARYVSHVPVHQDGSCNGLQHYAALGRDLTGGYAVNLCPTDKPQVGGGGLERGPLGLGAGVLLGLAEWAARVAGWRLPLAGPQACQQLLTHSFPTGTPSSLPSVRV